MDNKYLKIKKKFIPILLMLAVIVGFCGGRFYYSVAYATEKTEAGIDNQVEVYWIHRYIPIDRNVNSIMPEDVMDLQESEQIISMIAQTVYGEANGMSLYDRSLVIWCILNRVDDSRFPNTIYEVITAPNQFCGYDSSKPITEENYKLAKDVLIRWHAEKECLGSVGRTLPSKYLYFYGKNRKNWYRENWNSGELYDFGLEDVYEK